MSLNRSQVLMVLAAVATAGLIAFAPQGDGTPVSEAGKAVKGGKGGVAIATASSNAVAHTLEVPQSRTEIDAKGSKQMFAQSSWVVVAPPPKVGPPPPPPPPPPPSAPALPFTFMGRYEQGDTNSVILARGNRVVIASKGDVIENNYRVEQIEVNKVSFTYLPLGTLQYLSTGSVP